MKNYKELSIRYLKMNKRRSIVTIIGVTVAVTVLYTILNLGWCALLNERESVREKQDYEMVFFTESEEQIARIMADERVKSAYVGSYYHYSYDNSQTYDNALYINITSPYRMDSIFEKLKEKYEVEGDVNEDLEVTYLQGDEANLVFISFLVVLLVSYIFAIFGIGIVRNSIQLSTLEQIKDYGNLRCVGASKGQLKAVVYLEGTVLELTGNGIGILLGWAASLIAGHFLHMKVGFHLMPIVPIVVAFLGDWYFAMEENCKVIVNLTPVSAIRGEYRIRKEKIRVRKKSIFGKLFGVEGDYAYKNIMRNPGRFVKTVWSIGIGIATFITVMSLISTVNGQFKEVKERYRYYQVYYGGSLSAYETIEGVQSSLPSASVLQAISDMDEVVEAKRKYSSMVLLTDWETHYGHYTEEFLNQTVWGEAVKNCYETLRDEGDEQHMYMKKNMTQICCYGYDEEDYKRFQSALVDGALDVSENGLVLVNGGKEVAVDQETYSMVGENYINVEFSDYKVGDTIDIIDMEKLRIMVDEEMRVFSIQYGEEKEQRDTAEKESGGEEEENDDDKYHEARMDAVERCRKRLVQEGAYKTYTIEGIVSENVNYFEESGEDISFILPLEQYYDFTGTDESMMTGMQYHFDRFSVNRFQRAGGYETYNYDTGVWIESSGYPWYMSMLEGFKNVFYGVMVFVVFVVMMSTFNIINTTASNLHLRRKEFAQLRMIGVSKKRLMKMVMLEGVISSVIANIVGILFGIVISNGSFNYVLNEVYDVRYQFPFLAALFGTLFSTMVLCGSVYVPLKGLKMDMASDLATGGD